jgi:hypothetical protein
LVLGGLFGKRSPRLLCAEIRGKTGSAPAALLIVLENQVMSNNEKPLLIKKCVRTCIACPSQWDAWLEDGRYVYIRYRWGRLAIRLEDEPLYEDQIGDNLDGRMTDAEMMQKTASILDFSKLDT